MSLLLVVVAGSVLAFFARHSATAHLSTIAQAHNEAISQVFLNQLWPHFSEFVLQEKARTPKQMRDEAQERALPERVRTMMRNSNIVKIKLYNQRGFTVFSSDPNQVGEDRRENPGFQGAMSGKSVSTLTHRNEIYSFEGTRPDVDLLSSYIPIRDGESVVGVMEVYQDVSPFMAQVDRRLFQVGGLALLLFAVMYLIQLAVVRAAQKVLVRHSAELERANNALDARVAARTEELDKANRKLQAEIHERQTAEQKLDHLAYHDPLTGLPNRLMFAEHLGRSIGKAERSNARLAVLFIDLDRFKEVNDTLGHAVGDELLVQVTERLRGQLRNEDLLARLGGDEFVCILEQLEGPQDASRVADKLIRHLGESFHLHLHEIRISASIGISLYPADGMDTNNLLRAADTAMYQAKKLGRNGYHFYAPEMTQFALDRVLLERLLHEAVVNHGLKLNYQIKMSVGSVIRPCGAEALARWSSAQLGVVAPTKFIPVAEETGIIVDLGEWVLRTACHQLMAWRTMGAQVPSISVNVSVRQLERPDFVAVVQSALAESGLPADGLELEITESVIMRVGNAIAVLQALHNMGVRLSVDDFGTGYSSLAYLKLLPIQTLKIDRSFVAGIGENAGDESIIQAVIGLAKNLGLTTVAEGVETPAQIAFLRQAGAGELQGFFYGEPLNADGFLAHWRHAQAQADAQSAVPDHLSDLGVG
ncbi:putative bifunctional diguanylate cyclase/phosphodiesterase [Rhodoferax aquaticus]|nr:EAL domain-containing protein [Rhodoferax aquaticus]